MEQAGGTGGFFLSPKEIERAVRLSYAQAMIGAVYLASTGGMFLIGYALALGANNVQIGLMSTVPMLCVVAQLAASAWVERGASRRRLTIFGAACNVAGWGLIILIPHVAADAPPALRVGMLIAVVTLVALFGQVAGNARGSWVGDLIPAATRGTFFGRMTMYGALVGTLFGLLEGRLLDQVKHLGIGAFGWLFAFGMAFGLLNALLFVPQADVPLARPETNFRFRRLVRETFRNGALVAVTVYAILWSMQGIAGPFYTTYMLRDLGMPFLGVALPGVSLTLTMLIAAPWWGRVVDRYGARPVLIACTFALAPAPLSWIWVESASAVYRIIVPLNLLVGFLIAGISVGLSVLLYKVTPSAGRSVQFAVYATLVTLLAAPMPFLGGYLPRLAETWGLPPDVRFTFYASALFIFAAAMAARALKEPEALPTRDLVRRLPAHLRRPATLKPAG